MKTTFKKIMSIMLTAMILITCTAIPAMAEEASNVLEGKKQAALINDDRFEVSIEIPGGDAEVKHDEVILMVDGSYSMDEEWEEMKETILTIGETVLDGSGHTTLTLMSFGISPNVVLEEIKTVDELAAKLPSKPGGLLYGRSATNCDGAFEGIQWYLDEHDETLGEVNVIFLSDGGANLNSQPVDWIATAGKLAAKNALAVQQDEFNQVVLGNAVISDASKTVYGENLDEMLDKWAFVIAQEAVLGELDAQLKELDPASDEYVAVKAQFDAELAKSNEAANYVTGMFNATNEAGKTNAQQWVIEVYKDFYAFRGLTEGEKYPVYVAEYAYVDYQNETNFRLNNTFYYVLGLSGISTDTISGVKGYYAAEEAAKAALHEKIDNLYIVRYGKDHRSNWMTEVPNSTFVQSDSVSTLTEALQETLQVLALTPYNNVVVTDYMSKWVNLDPSTIKIVNVVDGQVLWTITDGWAEGVTPLTEKETPVVVELVDPADYNAGGADVIGNENGDIYKLTWYIKDGALLRSDNYKIVYEVEVDTDEKDYVIGTDYPANGNTDLTYEDPTGKNIINKIVVPKVKTIPTSVSVQKVWEDEDNIDGYRPDSVTIVLIADGEKTDRTLVLNAENNFAGTFSNLPVNKNGVAIVYTVEELEVEYYESSITGNATDGFVITNTYIPDTIIDDEDIPLNPPPTGDNITVTMWIAVAAICGAFVVMNAKKTDKTDA